jgi:hypothetical protein
LVVADKSDAKEVAYKLLLLMPRLIDIYEVWVGYTLFNKHGSGF